MKMVIVYISEFRFAQVFACIVHSALIRWKQWQAKVDAYLEALCREIRAVASMMKSRKLDAIYIGEEHRQPLNRISFAGFWMPWVKASAMMDF